MKPMPVKPMPGRRPNYIKVAVEDTANPSLETLIDKLTKYGLPVIHPYMDKSSDGNFRKGLPVKAKDWTCRINCPHWKGDLDPNKDSKREHNTHMTPRGFGANGPTARAAIYKCLKRVEFYYRYGWLYLWPIERKPKSVPDCSHLKD